MFQTGYKPLITLSRNLDYIGGFCKWWYTPVENILAFPAIAPSTQDYGAQPTLKEGAVWYGPVRVPDSQLGFDENEKQAGAGRYYEIEVNGFHPGDERGSRSNLQNMGNHKYVIVAKQRSGGFYLLIGNQHSPLDFVHSFGSKGGLATPGSKFEFKGELRHKCPSLDSFDGDDSLPPVNNTSTMNDSEIIHFTDESEVVVEWNTTRKNRFGSFPQIEVWINEGPGNIYKENSNISVDLAPPATTQFTIELTGEATGWVVLK